jgi:hypothetical protein
MMADVNSDDVVDSSQDYLSAAAAAASVNCAMERVIKTERTRSLPSTPNSVFPAAVHKDFVSTSNVAEPDIPHSNKPSMTSLNDGCWTKRAVEKMNNPFSVNSGGIENVFRGGMHRCSTDPKHLISMTPTSDVSTPSDDVLQVFSLMLPST